MPWDGDISRMGQLAERLAELASVPSRAARKVSDDLADEIQAEFDAGRDPYGESWQPLALATVDNGRTEPPLTDTHKMRDSLDVKPMRPAGIAMSIGHPAAAHQTGWDGPRSSGPSRPILPMRGEMPARWRAIIEDAITGEISRRGPR